MISHALVSTVLIQAALVIVIFFFEGLALWYNARFNYNGQSHFMPLSHSAARDFLDLFKEVKSTLEEISNSPLGHLINNERIQKLIGSLAQIWKVSIVKARFQGGDRHNTGLYYDPERRGGNRPINQAFFDLFNFQEYIFTVTYGHYAILPFFNEYNKFSNGKNFSEATAEDIERILEDGIRLIYSWQHKQVDSLGRMRISSNEVSIESMMTEANWFQTENEGLFIALDSEVDETNELYRKHGVAFFPNLQGCIPWSNEEQQELRNLTPRPRWLFFKMNFLPMEVFFFRRFYFAIFLMMPVIICLAMLPAVDSSLAYWFSVYFCSLIPWPQVLHDTFGPGWTFFPFDYKYRLHAQFGISTIVCFLTFVYNSLSSRDIDIGITAERRAALRLSSVFPLLLLASIGYEGIFILFSFMACEESCTYLNIIRKLHIILAGIFIWAIYDLNAVGGSIIMASFGLTVFIRLMMYLTTFRCANLTADYSMADYAFFSRLLRNRSFEQVRLTSSSRTSKGMPNEQYWVVDPELCFAAELYGVPFTVQSERDPKLTLAFDVRTTSNRAGKSAIFQKLSPGIRQVLLAGGISCSILLNRFVIESLGLHEYSWLYASQPKRVCFCRSRYGWDPCLMEGEENSVLLFITEVSLPKCLVVLDSLLLQAFYADKCHLTIVAEIPTHSNLYDFSKTVYSRMESICRSWISQNIMIPEADVIKQLNLYFERVKVIWLTMELPKLSDYNLPSSLFGQLETFIGDLELEVQKCLGKHQRNMFLNIFYFSGLIGSISLRRYILRQEILRNSSESPLDFVAFCSTAESLLLRELLLELDDGHRMNKVAYCTEDMVSSNCLKSSREAFSRFMSDLYVNTSLCDECF